jgi:hypothetical protein
MVRMPVSPTIRERCRALLPTGEEIRYLIPVTSTVVPVGAPFAVGHFIVAVTDTTVTVLYMGMLRNDRPQSVWAQYPRTTRLGPIDTDSYEPEFRLGSLVMEVDQEYLPVIAAADSEISAPDFPPPNLLGGG